MAVETCMVDGVRASLGCGMGRGWRKRGGMREGAIGNWSLRCEWLGHSEVVWYESLER